jgi:hypothetical protein
MNTILHSPIPRRHQIKFLREYFYPDYVLRKVTSSSPHQFTLECGHGFLNPFELTGVTEYYCGACGQGLGMSRQGRHYRLRNEKYKPRELSVVTGEVWKEFLDGMHFSCDIEVRRMSQKEIQRRSKIRIGYPRKREPLTGPKVEGDTKFMNPTILHIPIPQNLLDEKRALLASHGFHFPGNTGSGSCYGIEFDYTYNGTHLILTITKKPSLMPLALIKAKLAQWSGVVPQETNK